MSLTGQFSGEEKVTPSGIQININPRGGEGRHPAHANGKDWASSADFALCYFKGTHLA